ncbi:MAG: CBM35 domain-containing protein [Protaetiibacter sp.]
MTGIPLRRSRPLALIVAIGLASAAIVATTASPAHAATTRYEAEQATLTGGATTASDHPGYSGAGFVGGYVDGNKGAATTSFAVSTTTTGSHTLALRYANGTGSAKTLTLLVDGTAQQVSLGATANWDSWATQSVSVSLASGSHTIAYRFGSADSGNVNLDALDVTTPSGGGGAGYSAGPVFEAEAATLGGGAVVATDHTGYSGSGFVGGYVDGNKGAAQTTFKVAVATAGAKILTLRYANGTGSAKTLTLRVDGTTQGQLTLPATASWDSWATVTANVTLAAGNRDLAVFFAASDTGNVNLDRLEIADAPGGGDPGGEGDDYATGPLFEAESATLTGGTTVASDHPGFSGTGFVGGYTDANAGSAATTFKVRVTEAGAKDLVVRYANGTTTTRTLSLVIDGTSTGQLSFPVTADWNSWATVSVARTLTAGDHDIRLAYATGDNGNLNLDRLEVAAHVEPQPAGPGEVEGAYLSGGAVAAHTTSGYAGNGYASGFTAVGARVVRTVGAGAAGTATATIRFATTSGARSLDLVVNGRTVGAVSFANGSGWRTVTASIPVRAGVNTVGLRAATSGADVLIDSITVSGETALQTRGATVPYTQYEAEAASTNGSVLAPSRLYGTVQAESSGRRAVRLDALGEQLSITLTAPAKGLVIRYSIPDAAAGGGLTSPLGIYADGTKVTDVTLSSAHSWVYGAYESGDGGNTYSNNPNAARPADKCGPNLAACVPHRFYDELRVQLPSELPVGTVLKLQKDSPAVSYIDVDLVEAEVIPAALTAPAGAISITSYGAVSGGGDDTTAITQAVAAAKSAGVPVWIPAGTFQVSTAIQVSGVTVLGAGPWYSTIQGSGNAGGFYGTGGGVTIADLSITGSATIRNDGAGQAAIEGDFASETLLQNVWIQHTKVGLWVRPGSKDVLAVGLRVRDTYADGVNLRSVSNTTIAQSTFRNTGDDALAMWSSDGPGSNNVFAFNTVQAPNLANGLAVYGGGGGNRIEDNLVADTVEAAAGIAVSTRFGVPFTGTTTVQRNTLTRTGSMESGWNAQLGALWVYADVHTIDAPIVIRDNTIADSTFAGVLMSWQKSIQQVSFEDVTVTGSGTYGIEIHATGSASFTDVSVSGSGTAGLLNDGGYVLNRVSGNSGF